jgi:hypothetical protein
MAHLSDSEKTQLFYLSQKSPEERFTMMLQLIQSQIDAMKAGLRQHTSNEEELQQCFQKKMKAIYSLKP